MTEPRDASTRALSEGGIAALHGFLGELPALVGPATGDEHNTIRAAIIPIACWRVPGVVPRLHGPALRPRLKLAKANFLAQGEDAGGKGDSQGCSEFNPVLVFSGEEQARFER